ncbi:RagB/SusD family nutrient uptake outer membrane protein [Saccharicrinis aurantiacus]|uniref:RagB/SusD family nutrient uptake outer membrane protein n=1 Tax=Saccharicrinis aurantiacus TaxID=1849719 RepID=UPI00249295EB|nr:RagB/SusD family nutrient uptake outer membrane protein [Saccharicrinis aurantiacus]
MNKNKILGILMLLFITTACSDSFLEIAPEDRLTTDNYYNDDTQMLTGGASLYNRPWFLFNEKFVICLDVYAGNASGDYVDIAQFNKFAVFAANQFTTEGYQSLFSVIAYSNSLLDIVENKAGPAVTTEVKEWSRGEGLFMRSLAYFYLVRTFGAVPILEDINQYGTDVVVRKNNVEDIYTLIKRDLAEAAQLLPIKWSDANLGRATKGATHGLLAEVYLTLGEYAKAKEHADLVINSGLYSLMPEYSDNFQPKNGVTPDNNNESVFELQWVSPPQGQHWYYTNTHQAYLAAASKLTGVGDGWATFIPCLDFIRAYEEGDLRRQPTIMEKGNFYPELVTKEGGFLVENALTNNYAGYRKYVVGSPEEWPSVNFMNTDVNTHIMRYAEVLLIRAEAILGTATSTTDAIALGDINKVRARAGLPALTEITLDDILQERRMELAIESGDRWFDLARIDRAKAIEILSNTDRAYLADRNDPESGSADGGRFVVPKESDFLLPLPQVETDINPLLLDEAVPYDFNK